MRWQFWQQPLPQKLSESVRKTLLNEFPLDAKIADRIRCFGKKGRFSGRRAKYIRIFDPALIEDGATTAPTYEGLLETHDHRRSLLFEGRTEKFNDNEQVFLTDRRIA